MQTVFKNPKLESFFIGTLLGDSYIYNGVFYCKQISEDLINFKAKFIQENLKDARVSISTYDEYTDKNGVHHQKYYLLCVNHPKVKDLYKVFYSEGKKVYPNGAILKLDPLGFAMWYADDGTTILVQINNQTKSAKNRRVQLCTDNFTQEEHKQIKKELEKLGYVIKLIDRKRGGQLRTQINGLSSQKFICMLEESFLNFPSLLYKLDLGYREKSLNKRTYVLEEYKNCFLRVSAHPQFKDRVAIKLAEIEDDIVQTTNKSDDLC